MDKRQNTGKFDGVAEQYKQSQNEIIYQWFLTHTATMLQCSRALGIERANICRRVADLRERGLLVFRYVDIDTLTGQKAGYWRGVKKDVKA